MPWFDRPLEQLRQYRTETEEPPELDQWWQLRLAQARAQAREPGLTRYEADIYAPVEVYDAEFSGAGGDRIRAWYLRPAGAGGRTPVVVKFIGYGGGRGLPTEHALLPALGYSVFVMDTRGQGGRWTTGATGDHPAGQPGGPENAKVMTRGIGRPEDYYYTRLFTDAAMAVEAARALTGAPRVAVSGSSQGGGLALASAALIPDQVAVFRRRKFDPHPPTNYCMPYHGRGVNFAVRQFEGQPYDRSHRRQVCGWDKNASLAQVENAGDEALSAALPRHPHTLR